MKSVLSVLVGLIIVSAAIGAIVFVPWGLGYIPCVLFEDDCKIGGTPNNGLRWAIGACMTAGSVLCGLVSWAIGDATIEEAQKKLSVITDRRRTRAETPAELRGAVDTPRSEE